MRFLMPAIAICSMCGTAIASPVQRGDVEIGVLTCGVNAPAAAEPKVEGPLAGQLRDAVCTFRPKNGPEETYFATVEGRSLTPDEGWTLIWTVNITAEMSLPGALQQSYVVDQSLPADPLSPLIGETNPNVVLHSLADRPEGSASRPQKPVPQGFIIIGLKLTLRSTAV